MVAKKILIVSDVHLKLRKHIDFERSRFRRLITNLQNTDADIIVFAGDLLDYARPTLEELYELRRAFAELTPGKSVYVIAGNHEAVTKDSSTYDFVEFNNVAYIQDDTITVNGKQIRLTSWTHIKNLCKSSDNSDILISHFRAEMPPLFTEEIDYRSFVDRFAYVFLGDIHTRYSPHANVFYTSSPYTVSATKKVTNDYGYIELSIGNSITWKYVDLELPQKISVTVKAHEFKDLDLSANNLYNIYVYGTPAELKRIHTYKKDRVTLTKIVEKKELNEETKLSIKEDKPFLDILTESVQGQVSNSNDIVSATLKSIYKDI